VTNIATHTQQLITAATPHPKPTIILGLSGGPDSVFLLHILNNLRNDGAIDLIAAHLDHQWRPDSVKDVEFCAQLCQKLNVNFISAQASSLATIKNNGSKEELGRKLRRAFFEQTRISHNADLIALAHHRDDQQETFFLRMLRGATLSGLTGMNAIERLYVRPLLHVSKQEIVAYLDTNKIAYVTDPTNISDQYLRNRIRNSLIPAIKQCDTRFDQNFKKTLDHLQAEDEYLQQQTTANFQTIFSLNDTLGHFVGKTKLLADQHPVMQRRIILYWLIQEKVPFTPSADFINEILRFLLSERGGTHQIGQTIMLHKKQQRCWIEKGN